MKLIILIYTVALFFHFSTVYSQAKIEKTLDSLIDSKALTIKKGKPMNGGAFQQDAIVTSGDYQYVTYYDSNRNVCLSRRQLPTGVWKTIKFKDYKQKKNDTHNMISMGICPGNGTIHLSFDHHCDVLHYRVSKKQVATNPEKFEWSTNLFGPVQSALEKGKEIRVVTYPKFWQMPDGGLQFCYRKGASYGGKRFIIDYDPKTGKWHNSKQIDSNNGGFMGNNNRCAYPNGYTYGPKNKLHTTWVYRETPKFPNRDLMYMYSEDNGKSWLNNFGKKIKGLANTNTENIVVVKIPYKYGLINTHGQDVDSQGRIHVVMWHCSEKYFKDPNTKFDVKNRWGPNEERRYHHYWRDKDARWHHYEFPYYGSRPKLFIDKKDNTWLIYTRKGNLEIASASAKSKWTDWKVVHVEKGPFRNEMVGDYYGMKKNGTLSIMTQGSTKKYEPTPLRIIDFKIK